MNFCIITLGVIILFVTIRKIVMCKDLFEN